MLLERCFAVRFYENRLEARDINRWHGLAATALHPILKPGQVVGEFGCGSGEFLKRLANQYQICGIGYDISQANIASVCSMGLAGHIVDFDQDPYPIEDGLLEVAIACEVIEHLMDPRLFIKEICRTVKPGGFLCLTTPNAFNVRRRFSYMLGFHTDPHMDPSRIDFAQHIRAFSFGMIANLLTQEGFHPVLALGDRTPRAQGPGMRPLRSLLSSNICYLAQK